MAYMDLERPDLWVLWDTKAVLIYTSNGSKPAWSYSQPSHHAGRTDGFSHINNFESVRVTLQTSHSSQPWHYTPVCHKISLPPSSDTSAEMKGQFAEAGLSS